MGESCCLSYHGWWRPSSAPSTLPATIPSHRCFGCAETRPRLSGTARYWFRVAVYSCCTMIAYVKPWIQGLVVPRRHAPLEFTPRPMRPSRPVYPRGLLWAKCTVLLGLVLTEEGWVVPYFFQRRPGLLCAAVVMQFTCCVTAHGTAPGLEPPSCPSTVPTDYLEERL